MNDDLIRRGKIGNDIALYMAENAYLNDTALDVLKMIAKWVEEQPAVDAVEVVRCKDCKRSGMYCFGASNTPRLACLEVEEDGFIRAATSVNEDDFCSHGERREDNA